MSLNGWFGIVRVLSGIGLLAVWLIFGFFALWFRQADGGWKFFIKSNAQWKMLIPPTKNNGAVLDYFNGALNAWRGCEYSIPPDYDFATYQGANDIELGHCSPLTKRVCCLGGLATSVKHDCRPFARNCP